MEGRPYPPVEFRASGQGIVWVFDMTIRERVAKEKNPGGRL